MHLGWWLGVCVSVSVVRLARCLGKGPIGVSFIADDLVAVADSWIDAIVVVNITSAKIERYHLLDSAHVTGIAASSTRLFVSGQKKKGLYSVALGSLSPSSGGGGSEDLIRRYAQLKSGGGSGESSVTVDGVSLTVNEVDDAVFGVNIIPHTWENTSLADIAVGSDVNIEADVIARYVARLLERNGT